ncbi:HAD-IA family hydrolase [Streptosporangium sp. NPDC000563]|uniref:HAD family hydrolase n=1 Tax=Streptosporangium sp. NPDC000563 TaxID=3154366 RepID=UPI00332E839B
MPYLVHRWPEVMDGLSRLRASGWKVAIVTNGTADNQLGKIQRTGLAEAVDAYALSGVDGMRKPDIGLFEVAAKRCGMALEGGGWMVGDNLVADIGGGRAVGLRTIWIDQGARGNIQTVSYFECTHRRAQVLENQACLRGAIRFRRAARSNCRPIHAPSKGSAATTL